jgi:hypothetical protein
MANTTDLDYQPFLTELMFSALFKQGWKELKLYAANNFM